MADDSDQKPKVRRNASNPGNMGKGRVKGVPNKSTALAKSVIEGVVDRLGGTERLLAWAQSDPANESDFWVKIFPKLLPLQLTGADGGALQVVIARADSEL